MTAKSPLDHLPRRSLFADAPVVAAAVRKEAKATSKGGRPAKHSDKPWEREGISRMTWYRRQKASAP